jgi:hypothetical protein
MWVNSLNIDGVYINNLYEEIKDGIVLLKILERIQPNVVNWKKVEMKPSMRIKKNINCNYAVEIGKKIFFFFFIIYFLIFSLFFFNFRIIISLKKIIISNRKKYGI